LFLFNGIENFMGLIVTEFPKSNSKTLLGSDVENVVY